MILSPQNPNLENIETKKSQPIPHSVTKINLEGNQPILGEVENYHTSEFQIQTPQVSLPQKSTAKNTKTTKRENCFKNFSDMSRKSNL